MPTIDRTIVEIERWFAQISRLEESKRDLLRTTFADESLLNEQWMKYEREILSCRQGIRRALEFQDRWPERFERHANGLVEFQTRGGFEDSVFIMTKYPGNDQSQAASDLRRVIDAVQGEVRHRGYSPRLASEQNHHRWLWDNVELYLCGCARGVAIVEDRYLPELNPNVAIEWGWMVGMGRKVLFLREERFRHDRADWAGLLSAQFSWEDPRPGIAAAVADFLPDRQEAKYDVD